MRNKKFSSSNLIICKNIIPEFPMILIFKRSELHIIIKKYECS